MLARVLSGALSGVEASIVEVEVHISSGGNNEFQIVGLPDAAIREARARIAAAIRNSGYEFPYQRITVNLAPAGVRKEGAAFDLPMAIGILEAAGIVRPDPRRPVMVGELSLDGKLRPIRGALSVALLVRRLGLSGLIAPDGNGREAALAEGVEVYPGRTLAQIVGFVNGTSPLPALQVDPRAAGDDGVPSGDDFQEVRGQGHVKRAIEVAVAGAHNLLMIGSPGSGKTMLARRIPSIMPPMTLDESLETTQVFSAAGMLGADAALIRRRSFRAPHHSISTAGLIGGGSFPRPGEVSLAHNGVLFLDELPEFSRAVLESLRQPLEERRATIARAQITLSFPAAIMLVAAMNPCRCGYAFSNGQGRECSCSPRQIEAYMSRISGPLLDRIDLRIHVPAVPYKDMTGGRPAEASLPIQERVVGARRVQLKRFLRDRIRSNAEMQSRHIDRYCRLCPEGERLMERAMTELAISARGWASILRVSRTIADLDGAEAIAPVHLAEAVRYRKLDN